MELSEIKKCYETVVKKSAWESTRLKCLDKLLEIEQIEHDRQLAANDKAKPKRVSSGRLEQG